MEKFTSYVDRTLVNNFISFAQKSLPPYTTVQWFEYISVHDYLSPVCVSLWVSINSWRIVVIMWIGSLLD